MAQLFSSTARPARLKAAPHAGDDYGATAQPDWREVDWPAQRHVTEIGGSKVNYVDMGEGDSAPAVLIHGLGGQWQNWLENVPRLAQGRRVIAVDLPGFGLSELPREEISISGYARVVDELCDRLGITSAAVIGNSMGGFVAAEMAISAPQRVERLVLVSAAGITTATLSDRPVETAARLLATGGAWLAASEAGRLRRLSTRRVLRHYALAFVSRHPSRLHADLVYEGMLLGTGKPGFQDALRACLSYDFRDRLPDIGCPTLIVWGRNDMVVPVEDAYEFDRLIPDSRTLILEDTGHVPMLERPETFNEAAIGFLAEVGEAREEASATA